MDPVICTSVARHDTRRLAGQARNRIILHIYLYSPEAYFPACNLYHSITTGGKNGVFTVFSIREWID